VVEVVVVVVMVVTVVVDVLVVDVVVVVVVVVVGTPLLMTSRMSAWLNATLNIAASSISPATLLLVPSICLMTPSIQPRPIGLLFMLISLPL